MAVQTLKQPGALTLLGALAAFPMALVAQQPTTVLVLRHANVIDPAQGQLMRDATVIVQDGKIARVVAAAVAEPAGATVLDLGGKYLLPGLIDAHVHISDFAAAKRALLSGVTTARDMGVSNFVDVGMRELVARGDLDAPEIVAAGYHIRPRPAPTIFTEHPELGDLLAPGLHGPEALRRAVRVMLQHHVQWIKVLATERAGTPETDPRKQVYSEAELRAIVAEAAKAAIPVAAHAHGEEGAHAAVVAGVRSIEHGTFLADSTLALMAKQGTFLVPTLAIEADLAQPGGDYDDPGLQIRGRFMRPRALEMAAHAYRLGVKMAAGTDTGYGPESVTRMSHEIEELVGVGLSPLEALRAATTGAADLVGVSDHTGRIAAGLDADLIVVERNPLDEVRTLEDVLLVVNNGKVVLNRLTW
jgi:imidazolonepropionase-like amidohydrolase